MNLAARYYAYLQRKCLEADKYSSLNEMRGQILPWLGGALALILLAMFLFPDGGTVSTALWIIAFALWFIGIGFVGTAFTFAARKRRRMADKSGTGGK